MKISKILGLFFDFLFGKLLMSIMDLIVLSFCIFTIFLALSVWEHHWLACLVMLPFGVLGGGAGAYYALADLIKTWKKPKGERM